MGLRPTTVRYSTSILVVFPLGLSSPFFSRCSILSSTRDLIALRNSMRARLRCSKNSDWAPVAFPMPMKKRVAVIGGGNVAMDSARCAQRLGADQVYIIYRRSEAEMPARAEEVENAHEEGIIFKFLTNPVRFLGNGRGWVSAMECIEMELGEPDSSGRRRPIPKEGSEFVMDIDTVVVALGTTPNPLVPSTTEGLETTRWGTVVVDEKTGQTTKPQVWAGGDLTTGAATVISAMDAGKTAAASIHEYLQGKSS